MSMEKPDLFDPETGESLGTAGIFEAVDRFDPETGEPLGEAGALEAPDQFDPETGEPLGTVDVFEAADQFDPETGEPLGTAGVFETPDRFDPETGQPLGKTGKKIPWGKFGKPVLIGGTAVCVCGVAAIISIAGGGLFKKPKDIVADAMTEIWDTVDEGYLEDTFGVKALSEMAGSGSVKMGGSLELNDIPGLGTLGSAGGFLEFSRNREQNAVRLGGTAEIANMELGEITLYMDDKQVAAAIPEFLDPVFAVNYTEDLSSQVDDSFLAESIGMESEDAEFASEFMTATNQLLSGKQQPFKLGEIYTRYKETTKAGEMLKDALEIEKADTKSFEVNGKEMKCKGYKVTVPKKALADFVKTAGKFIESDERLKQNEFAWITDTLTVAMMMNGYHHGDAAKWAETQTNELIDVLIDTTDEGQNLIKDYMDDIDMVLYVDKKGHAVFLSMETTFDDDYDAEMEFTFSGGEIPTKNMEGNIEIKSGSDLITAAIEKTENVKNDKYTLESTLEFSSGYENVKLTIGTVYNEKDGDFEMEASGAFGPAKFSANAEGIVTEHKKGTSLAMEIDSIGIEGPFFNWDGLNGSFFIEPLSGKLTAPEGEIFDIIAASRTDWEDVTEDAQSAIMDVRRAFSGF